VVFAVLVFVHVVMKAALFPKARTAPLHGDEVAYMDSARSIAHAVHAAFGGGSLNLRSLEVNVVGNGWFMPGMSIVLTPLLLVDPHASVTAMRIYLGVLTTVLLIVTAFVVRRILGRWYGAGLLLFPGLLPMWLLFSYTAFGDLAAGLVVVIVVAYLIHLGRHALAGQPPRWSQAALLGVLLAVTLYLRSSALPLVGGLLALALLAAVFWLRQRARVRAVAAVLVAGLVFGVLLAPWSVLASHVLGGRVVTTSTLPISEAVAYGDPNRLCFGPCRPTRNIWDEMVQYSRQVARATGTNEILVQKQMSNYALSGLSPHRFASSVVADFHRYSLAPDDFSAMFDSSTSDPWSTVIRSVSALGYYAVLALASLSLLLVVRRNPERQMLSLLVKLAGAALVLQPFVHISSGRYWPIYAPLMALGAVLLGQSTVRAWRGRTASAASTLEDRPGVRRGLVIAQIVSAAGYVAVAVGLAAFALA